MLKNLTIIFMAVVVLVIDLFGSYYFIAGIAPLEVFGWSKKGNNTLNLTLPKISSPLQQSLNANKNTFTIIRSDFDPAEVIAGQSGNLNCDYENSIKDLSEISEEVLLTSQRENNTFFISKNQENIDFGSGTLSLKIDIPGTMLSGPYKAAVSIYDKNTRNKIGRCNTGLFLVSNSKPGLQVADIVTKNHTNSKIPVISSSDKKISVTIVTSINSTGVTPKVRIIDPLFKFDKVLFDKELESVDVYKNKTLTLNVDVSGFNQLGIFIFTLDLYGADGNIIAKSPLFPVIIGEPPVVSNAAIIKNDNNSYGVKLSYTSGSILNNSNLKVIIGLCGDKDCDFIQKTTNDNLIDTINFPNSSRFTGKMTVNTLVVNNGINDAIDIFKTK